METPILFSVAKSRHPNEVKKILRDLENSSKAGMSPSALHWIYHSRFTGYKFSMSQMVRDLADGKLSTLGIPLDTKIEYTLVAKSDGRLWLPYSSLMDHPLPVEVKASWGLGRYPGP